MINKFSPGYWGDMAYDVLAVVVAEFSGAAGMTEHKNDQSIADLQ